MSAKQAQKTRSGLPHHVARIRIGQSLISFIAIAIVGGLSWSVLSPPWWWITVGAATLISAALLEPNYTDPRSAVANAAAAIAAWLTATHDPVNGLWIVYAIFTVLLLLFALFSLAVPPGAIRTVTKWIATRLSRGRVLGFSAMAIEVIRV